VVDGNPIKILKRMGETVLLVTLGYPCKDKLIRKSACFIVPERGRRQTSVLDKEYVLGLVDGEGSFNVRINRQPTRRAKVELKFSLKLRYQDKEILDALKQFFGCGNVYIQNDKRANHSLCYRYEVQNRKEIIATIIPFFEANPPKAPSRKRDFELFKRITELLQSGSVDVEHIEFLKQQMHWGLAAYGKSVRAVETPVALLSEQGNARQATRAGFR
jgi:hypothetical protein